MGDPCADLPINPTCKSIPVFTPVSCGIPGRREYYDYTTRAARKALKSPSLFSGQAQSTRIRALKTCITQVNTSEKAYNQVERINTIICDTVQTQELQNYRGDVVLKPPLYSTEYTNPTQPDLSIVTVDPSGNVYNLLNDISGGRNYLTVTKYDASDNSFVLAGPTLDLSNTLVSANLFWTNNTLTFVGIFYSTYTYVRIYTYNVGLTATLQKEIDDGTTNPIQYSGQSMYNSNGYIYIALSIPPSYPGYESAFVWLVKPDLSIVKTILGKNYTSIQQCVSDMDGFVFITAKDVFGIDILIFTSNSATFIPFRLFDNVTYCAITVINTTSVNTGNVSVPNLVLALGANGSTLLQRVITYIRGDPTSFSFQPLPGTPITVPWPNYTPYQILGVTLCSNAGADSTAQPDQLHYRRFFYTLYLYNPALTNFEWYVQYGELDGISNTPIPSSTVPSDSITPPPGTPIPNPINIQINSQYKVNPTNISQTNTRVLAITNGLRLIFYNITYTKLFQEYISVDVYRKYCLTKVLYPGCDCLTSPVNNNPSLDSFTHTLDIAICKPIQFSNPALSDGCAPVYTEPTQYLTVADGAEPPQGPAVKTIYRKYNRINGIDEICKPIPGRYASTRTARIRANIESASDTRYVNTEPPLVQYPFPCPVYGNQTGIPQAQKCVPTIDGRPGTG